MIWKGKSIRTEPGKSMLCLKQTRKFSYLFIYCCALKNNNTEVIGIMLLILLYFIDLCEVK